MAQPPLPPAHFPHPTVPGHYIIDTTGFTVSPLERALQQLQVQRVVVVRGTIPGILARSSYRVGCLMARVGTVRNTRCDSCRGNNGGKFGACYGVPGKSACASCAAESHKCATAPGQANAPQVVAPVPLANPLPNPILGPQPTPAAGNNPAGPALPLPPQPPPLPTANLAAPPTNPNPPTNPPTAPFPPPNFPPPNIPLAGLQPVQLPRQRPPSPPPPRPRTPSRTHPYEVTYPTPPSKAPHWQE
ncbi:MAG: hedgehog receptor activity [Icmadophila ericetorum]|nr:hedgehog receptor activity [Icmadophila ericetorum]